MCVVQDALDTIQARDQEIADTATKYANQTETFRAKKDALAEQGERACLLCLCSDGAIADTRCFLHTAWTKACANRTGAAQAWHAGGVTYVSASPPEQGEACELAVVAR